MLSDEYAVAYAVLGPKMPKRASANASTNILPRRPLRNQQTNQHHAHRSQRIVLLNTLHRPRHTSHLPIAG